MCESHRLNRRNPAMNETPLHRPWSVIGAYRPKIAKVCPSLRKDRLVELPPLSRPALLTWMVATAVAAFPTWEEWRFRLHPDPVEMRACMGSGWLETSPLDPLRGDLDGVMQNVEAWAIPALLVLGDFSPAWGTGIHGAWAGERQAFSF